MFRKNENAEMSDSDYVRLGDFESKDEMDHDERRFEAWLDGDDSQSNQQEAPTPEVTIPIEYVGGDSDSESGDRPDVVSVHAFLAEARQKETQHRVSKAVDTKKYEEKVEEEKQAVEARKAVLTKAEIDLLEKAIQLAIVDNILTDSLVSAAEQTDIIVIFGNFLTEAGQKFIETVGHFIFFPGALLAAIWRTDLAIEKAMLEKGKNGGYYKAAVEFVATALIGTAVVGGLVAQAFAAAVSPVIFTVMLIGRAAFFLASSVFYLGKSLYAASQAKTFERIEKKLQLAASKDPANSASLLADAASATKMKKYFADDAEKYRTFAKLNAIGFVTAAVSAVAVAFVMIAAKPLVGIFGIFASAYGVYAAGKNYLKYRAEKKKLLKQLQTPVVQSEVHPIEAPKRTVNAGLHQTLGVAPAPAGSPGESPGAASSVAQHPGLIARATNCVSSLRHFFWQDSPCAPISSVIPVDEKVLDKKTDSGLVDTNDAPRRQSFSA